MHDGSRSDGWSRSIVRVIGVALLVTPGFPNMHNTNQSKETTEAETYPNQDFHGRRTLVTPEHRLTATARRIFRSCQHHLQSSPEQCWRQPGIQGSKLKHVRNAASAGKEGDGDVAISVDQKPKSPCFCFATPRKGSLNTGPRQRKKRKTDPTCFSRMTIERSQNAPHRKSRSCLLTDLHCWILHTQFKVSVLRHHTGKGRNNEVELRYIRSRLVIDGCSLFHA